MCSARQEFFGLLYDLAVLKEKANRNATCLHELEQKVDSIVQKRRVVLDPEFLEWWELYVVTYHVRENGN